MSTLAATLGELKATGWISRSVKDELRSNLIKKLQRKEPLFEGIIGYDKTVLPQLEKAILAKHDILLLGLRGQAKTRILRSLVGLLDEYIPIVAGSDVMDDPYHPISKYAKQRLKDLGDATPIAWVHRNDRYAEKLATPDTTVADLIGDIDPIKAATQRLNLSDEEVIHFGIIPRANRGIFVLNELPDLQPRIQVALLNIMQERDIQVRGFTIRLPLDMAIYFSANPEDYTNRGNIITPLKDRIDAQIITHYPLSIASGMKITEQEAWVRRGLIDIYVPDLLREVVEAVAFEARQSEFVDQKSGVSARLTISTMEQVVSSAERRAILNGEPSTTVRITDVFEAVAAITGKLELVYEGEQEGAAEVATLLIGKAVARIFKAHFPNPESKTAKDHEYPYAAITSWFANGNKVEVSNSMTEKDYEKALNMVEGLQELVARFLKKKQDTREYVFAKDLVLEGLHQHSIVGKEQVHQVVQYSDMVGSMLGSLGSLDEEEGLS